VKLSFVDRVVFVSVLLFLIASTSLWAQVETADLVMTRVRDVSTASVTYGFEAEVEGTGISRVQLLTPLSKTFTLYDTAISMEGVSLELYTEVTGMSESFFTTNFPNGLYKFQATFANATSQDYPITLNTNWPDFPTVVYPASGATDVPDAPVVQWTSTTGAFAYSVEFDATNYHHNVSRDGILPPNTAVQFPQGTLLMGDTYMMIVGASNDGARSGTRLSFKAAANPSGLALRASFPDNYLVGAMKSGAAAYRFHGEVRPAASGYSRFQIKFPESAGTLTLFESPLASNPFQVWANLDAGLAYSPPSGTYDVILRRDNGSNSTIHVNSPTQYPAGPTVLAPLAGQRVPPGGLEHWSIGSGTAPNAVMREIHLDRWDVTSFLNTSTTQTPIPAFGPSKGPVEDAQLWLMTLKLASSGDATSFTGTVAQFEFKIQYPSAVDQKNWTLYP
jgi:hypothetical protein